MELRRLYMRNFLAVGDEPVEILFALKGGITVIKGNNQDVSGKSSNGSGKSTIIEAIFFGLAGATLRKLNLEGILHNKKSGECVVEIEFDNVKIVRTISPKGKGGCKLYVDGAERTTASIKETNKLVNEIVGINFETLSNILIFGQHNIVSFLESGEGEKREIIENLMNLREYNEYEESARELLKQSKATMKSLTDKHGVHSTYLAEQQTLLAKQRVALADYRRLLTIDIGMLDANIASMPDLDQLKGMWRQYNEYLDAKKKLEDRISQLTVERNQYQSEYNNTVSAKQTDSQNKQPLIDKLNQVKAKAIILEERKRQLWQEIVHPLEAGVAEAKANACEAQEIAEKSIDEIKPSEDWDFQIGNVNKQIAQQKKRVDDILDKGLKNNETCPTCYGTVDAKNAHNIISAIEIEVLELQTKLADIEAKKIADLHRVEREKSRIIAQFDGNIEADHEEISCLIRKLDEAKEKVKTQYFGAKEKLDNLVLAAQAEVDNFDVDLNDRHDPIIASKESVITSTVGLVVNVQTALKRLIPVNQPTVAVEEIGKLQAQLETHKKEKAEKEKLLTDSPYVEMIATFESGITKIEVDIEAVNKDIKRVEGLLPYYQFWVDHMGTQGLKSYVVDQVLPTLNQQIDYWMQIIYSGAISVKFDKYLNVSMKNVASGNEMIFGQGSGGERRRIDLAIMLSFRQIMQLTNGKQPNILVLDEVAESLDEPGVYGLHSAIRELAKTDHVYVITHNMHLLQLLENENVIQVEKRNGSMRLV